jgi:hypothetical protein
MQSFFTNISFNIYTGDGWIGEFFNIFFSVFFFMYSQEQFSFVIGISIIVTFILMLIMSIKNGKTEDFAKGNRNNPFVQFVFFVIVLVIGIFPVNVVMYESFVEYKKFDNTLVTSGTTANEIDFLNPKVTLMCKRVDPNSTSLILPYKQRIGITNVSDKIIDVYMKDPTNTLACDLKKLPLIVAAPFSLGSKFIYGLPFINSSTPTSNNTTITFSYSFSEIVSGDTSNDILNKIKGLLDEYYGKPKIDITIDVDKGLIQYFQSDYYSPFSPNIIKYPMAIVNFLDNLSDIKNDKAMYDYLKMKVVGTPFFFTSKFAASNGYSAESLSLPTGFLDTPPSTATSIVSSNEKKVVDKFQDVFYKDNSQSGSALAMFANIYNKTLYAISKSIKSSDIFTAEEYASLDILSDIHFMIDATTASYKINGVKTGKDIVTGKPYGASPNASPISYATRSYFDKPLSLFENNNKFGLKDDQNPLKEDLNKLELEIVSNYLSFLDKETIKLGSKANLLFRTFLLTQFGAQVDYNNVFASESDRNIKFKSGAYTEDVSTNPTSTRIIDTIPSNETIGKYVNTYFHKSLNAVISPSNTLTIADVIPPGEMKNFLSKTKANNSGSLFNIFPEEVYIEYKATANPNRDTTKFFYESLDSHKEINNQYLRGAIDNYISKYKESQAINMIILLKKLMKLESFTMFFLNTNYIIDSVAFSKIDSISTYGNLIYKSSTYDANNNLTLLNVTRTTYGVDPLTGAVSQTGATNQNAVSNRSIPSITISDLNTVFKVLFPNLKHKVVSGDIDFDDDQILKTYSNSTYGLKNVPIKTVYKNLDGSYEDFLKKVKTDNSTFSTLWTSVKSFFGSEIEETKEENANAVVNKILKQKVFNDFYELMSQQNKLSKINLHDTNQSNQQVDHNKMSLNNFKEISEYQELIRITKRALQLYGTSDYHAKLYYDEKNPMLGNGNVIYDYFVQSNQVLYQAILNGTMDNGFSKLENDIGSSLEYDPAIIKVLGYRRSKTIGDFIKIGGYYCKDLGVLTLDSTTCSNFKTYISDNAFKTTFPDATEQNEQAQKLLEKMNSISLNSFNNNSVYYFQTSNFNNINFDKLTNMGLLYNQYQLAGQNLSANAENVNVFAVDLTSIYKIFLEKFSEFIKEDYKSNSGTMKKLKALQNSYSSGISVRNSSCVISEKNVDKLLVEGKIDNNKWLTHFLCSMQSNENYSLNYDSSDAMANLVTDDKELRLGLVNVFQKARNINEVLNDLESFSVNENINKIELNTAESYKNKVELASDIALTILTGGVGLAPNAGKAALTTALKSPKYKEYVMGVLNYGKSKLTKGGGIVGNKMSRGETYADFKKRAAEQIVEKNKIQKLFNWAQRIYGVKSAIVGLSYFAKWLLNNIWVVIVFILFFTFYTFYFYIYHIIIRLVFPLMLNIVSLLLALVSIGWNKVIVLFSMTTNSASSNENSVSLENEKNNNFEMIESLFYKVLKSYLGIFVMFAVVNFLVKFLTDLLFFNLYDPLLHIYEDYVSGVTFVLYASVVLAFWLTGKMSDVWHGK